MKRNANESWIAGAVMAACALALVCVVALPHAAIPPGSTGSGNQRMNIELPADGATLQPAGETAPAAVEGDVADDPYGGMEYESGVVLVTLPAGVSPADAASIIAEETGVDGIALANEADAMLAAATAAEEPQLVELSIPSDMPIEEAVNRVSASSAVAAAQPNFLYGLADERDSETRARDALIAQNFVAQGLMTQTALANDEGISSQWMLPSIYAYDYENPDADGYAWKIATTDRRVTVAIIDVGFQADHVDLAANVVDTYNSALETTGTAAVSEVESENGHGTHVAGIVSAVANNGAGVAGVSYNAQLMLIKAYDERVADKSKAFTSDSYNLYRAFNRAIDNRNTSLNVRVINFSLAATVDWADKDWQDNLLIGRIDAATNAGIVVVAAAGNQGKSGTAVYPSDYRNVVGVISLRKSGSDVHKVSRASSSNFNSATQSSALLTGKDMSAPGEDIYSTIPTNTYGFKNGTSMATPVVSGVLALLFAEHPELTAQQAIDILHSTATDINDDGWDVNTGYGEVNAYKALANADAFLSGGTSVQAGKSITLRPPGWIALSWESSNEAIATVQGGKVTGVSGGTVRISATVGTLRGILTVYQDVTVFDPAISGSSSAAVGSTTQLKLTGKSIAGAWTWTSTDSSVATVSSNGVVTGRKVGTTTITATLSDNPSISATKSITITQADMASAMVVLSRTSYTYDGTAKRPTVTSVKVGSNTLYEGTDYKVSGYSNNKNAGTASVTLIGLGNYIGSKTVNFTIAKANVSSATVTLSPASGVYDGKAHTPTPNVYLGGRLLENGADYSVAYKGNTAVGTATVTVTGKGNYTGGKTASFTISAARQPMYRLYNPNSGEHFYTATASERGHLVSVGWGYEGVAWQAPSVSNTPVYRLYNPNAGDHHYTTNANERDHLRQVGWSYEGIGWYSDDARAVVLYRLYNPNAVAGAHHYTTNAYERDQLTNVGWRYEGTAWYGMS